jgi:hypothetical protein
MCGVHVAYNADRGGKNDAKKKWPNGVEWATHHIISVMQVEIARGTRQHLGRRSLA